MKITFPMSMQQDRAAKPEYKNRRNGMNKSGSLISVIVPVYNTEKYLQKCVETITRQTYENLEIILVDDGSMDSSGKLCDDFAEKDGRVRVIHKENGGVSSARNEGLDQARGQYIMFVDSDDEIVPECVEILFDSICKYHADIACAGTLGVDNRAYFEGDVCVWNQKEALEHSLMDHPYTFSVWSKLYSKDIIGKKRFLRDVKINEDTMFLFEILCKQPKVINIKTQVYYYRPNESSVSRSRYTDKFKDILVVSNRKYQIVKNDFPELIGVADNMRLKASMNLLRILFVRTTREKRTLESELIRMVKKNSKAYISMNASDDEWLRIVKYNLYYICKFGYHCLKKRV